MARTYGGAEELRSDVPKFVRAIGDSLMQIPAFPGNIATHEASAFGTFGSDVKGAVSRVTGNPGLPGPGTLLAGGFQYAAAYPKALAGGIIALGAGLKDTIDDIGANLKRI